MHSLAPIDSRLIACKIKESLDTGRPVGVLLFYSASGKVDPSESEHLIEYSCS